MIQHFSKIKKLSYDNFLSETFEQFSARHELEFLPLFDEKESDLREFGAEYFALIPKTYNKKFPAKSEFKHLLDVYSPKADETPFLNVVKTINAAVTRDREDWNQNKSLPGLSNKGRKPGSPNKPKDVVPLQSLDIVEELTGASHKDIAAKLAQFFPATDEEIQKLMDGEDLTPKQQVEAYLANKYQADLEVAAKQGDKNEVQALVSAVNRDRKKYSRKPELLKAEVEGQESEKEKLNYLRSLPKGYYL